MFIIKGIREAGHSDPTVQGLFTYLIRWVSVNMSRPQRLVKSFVIFPHGLTFLVSVFGTFLTRFSDPAPAGYLQEFKVLT